ncbi:MAG TPA: amidohydrolase family protein [Bacteroidota bacterium]|nr:amidohydrolase family protein [Bacteroidota bacterium]
MSLRFLAPLLFISILCFAQDKPIAFRGATVYPIEGPAIENGILILKGGIITAVGKSGGVSIPSDAEVRDVTGKVIMPGLVDTHSHIGGGSGGDQSAATHPDVRILDAVDPRHDYFKKALAGGITSVNVMPGSGHLMSGQTVYLKLRAGANTINDMLFCTDPLNDICGGMKMANGTNSIREKPFPGTRAKSAAMIRQLFVKAQEYRARVQAAKGNPEKMPKRELDMEALVQVLDGKRIVHHHTHKQEDILTVLRLKQEFGFRVVLHHVSEAWKVAKEIAAAGVPSSIIVLDSPGGKLEAVDISYENGAALEKAGALVGYHTDDGVTDSRLFLRAAAFGVRAGMSREKALEALTLAGAKMMDLDKRIGSLKPGKDADFIILSGDPLSTYTHVEQTWVEGKKVYDRLNPDDRKYSTGGYEVFRDGFLGDACEGGDQ